MGTDKSHEVALVYEGSVKRVWECSSNLDKLWFEFTDDYSVFDWGKMPDTILNKGRALALIGGYFFEELKRPDLWRQLPASPHLSKFDSEFLQKRWRHKVFAGANALSEVGLASHYECLVDKKGQQINLLQAGQTKPDQPIYMQVLRAEVYHPQAYQVMEQNLFFYNETGNPAEQSQTNDGAPISQTGQKPKSTVLHSGQDAWTANSPGEREASAVSSYLSARSSYRLVPLEVVFRFGMPEGSSLAERLRKDPEYFKTLGLSCAPAANKLFERPVIEFSTKLEPKDRMLSWQEAVVLSGLSPQQFEEMIELTLDIALALHHIFGSRSIELWDGKFEFIQALDSAASTPTSKPPLLLADSIGPDELRLLYKGKQLSKEMIRQFYRGSQWEKSLKQAQSMAQSRGTLDWKTIAESELDSRPLPLSAAFKQSVDKLYGVLANTILQSDIFGAHPTLDEYVQQLPGVAAQKCK